MGNGSFLHPVLINIKIAVSGYCIGFTCVNNKYWKEMRIGLP
jgi:hypothetical protein